MSIRFQFSWLVLALVLLLFLQPQANAANDGDVFASGDQPAAGNDIAKQLQDLEARLRRLEGKSTESPFGQGLADWVKPEPDDAAESNDIDQLRWLGQVQAGENGINDQQMAGILIDLLKRIETVEKEESEKARNIASEIVKQMPKTGKVVVTNRMNSTQSIEINGRWYALQANQMLTMKDVPVGNVITRLPGQPSRNWYLGAPEYQQRIKIAPDQNAMVPVQPVQPVIPWGGWVNTYYWPY